MKLVCSPPTDIHPPPPPPPAAIIEADSFKTADPLFTSLVELGVGKDALSSTFPNPAKPAEPIGTA